MGEPYSLTGIDTGPTFAVSCKPRRKCRPTVGTVVVLDVLGWMRTRIGTQRGLVCASEDVKARKSQTR